MPIRQTTIDGDQAKDQKTDEPASTAAPAPDEAPKRKRRTKKEMISDAVIPGADDAIEVKFQATGTVGERPWSEAARLVSEGKAEFVKKDLKYALLKQEEQTAAGDGDAGEKGHELGVDELTARWVELEGLIDACPFSDEQRLAELNEESKLVRERIMDMGGEDPASDEAYERRSAEKANGAPSVPRVPDAAEVGDKIVVGGSTYYLGYQNNLIKHPPGKPNSDELVQANTLWEQKDGEWFTTDLREQRKREAAAQDGFHDPAPDAPAEEEPETKQVGRAALGAFGGETDDGGVSHRGGPEVTHATAEPVEVNGLNTGLWKVSMGYLEKIGLPEYSSLQIGPASAQRYVLDDGRRMTVAMHGREVQIPTSVVEAMQESAQVCEYVMRAERQAMVNFLEAVKPGSTKSQ